MDLFEYMRSTNMEKEAPLAARMRPRTLDEVVGQEHIIGKDKLLYRAIKADKISYIFVYSLLLMPYCAAGIHDGLVRLAAWRSNRTLTRHSNS